MRRSHALLCVLSVFVAGCGGGGGGGGGGSSSTVSLDATSELSGYVAARGDFFHKGTNLFIGDVIPGGGEAEEGLRGFLSFDLAPIPAGAEILSAELHVTQTITGNDPYSLGALLLDQVAYGDVFDPGAYDTTYPSHQGFVELSTDATLGPKAADVTVAVQEDVGASRSRSQFRLRFSLETNTNGNGDQAIFVPNPSVPAEQAVLVVTYRN